MGIDEFWDLVERARERASDASDIEDVAERLVEVLAAQGPERIREADVHLNTLMARAYGYRLWGAAYVMNGGCSDDGFDYFLGWLIGQGRAVFERALADPDSLADVVSAEDEDFQSEELMSAPWSAYERATGRHLPDSPAIVRPELGAGWDFDNAAEMSARYPRLTAILG